MYQGAVSFAVLGGLSSVMTLFSEALTLRCQLIAQAEVTGRQLMSDSCFG